MMMFPPPPPDDNPSADANPMDCIPAVANSSIIAYYPFSHGSLEDYSGNGHDLVNNTTASPAEDRNGDANCAFSFDKMASSPEFLTSADGNVLDGLTDFSVSLWYYRDGTSNGGGTIETLFSNGQKTGCPDRDGKWSLSLYDLYRGVFGYINENSVWFTYDSQTQITNFTDRWIHMVATFNAADDEMKIYEDGQLQETAIGDADCGYTTTPTDIGKIFIGQHFNGSIDDIIVYDITLDNNK